MYFLNIPRILVPAIADAVVRRLPTTPTYLTSKNPVLWQVLTAADTKCCDMLCMQQKHSFVRDDAYFQHMPYWYMWTRVGSRGWRSWTNLVVAMALLWGCKKTCWTNHLLELIWLEVEISIQEYYSYFYSYSVDVLKWNHINFSLGLSFKS